MFVLGYCLSHLAFVTHGHRTWIDSQEAGAVVLNHPEQGWLQGRSLSKSLARLLLAPNPTLQLSRIAEPASSSIVASAVQVSDPPQDKDGRDIQGLVLSYTKALSLDGEVRLILASQSPRRKEILDMMGLKNKYSVQPSPLDEQKLQKELAASPTRIHPQDYARKLAESKAHALGESLKDSENFTHRSTFILGSDTIVDFVGQILEKPSDIETAKAMLAKLSGSWHEVHTGVALYQMDHQDENGDSHALTLVSSFTDTARVKFTSLSADDIDAYVATGEPMDKAGSYGIQGIGGQIVERIDGDFYTVMGLPMHRVSRELAKALSQYGVP